MRDIVEVDEDGCEQDRCERDELEISPIETPKDLLS